MIRRPSAAIISRTHVWIASGSDKPNCQAQSAGMASLTRRDFLGLLGTFWDFLGLFCDFLGLFGLIGLQGSCTHLRNGAQGRLLCNELQDLETRRFAALP